jgi:DNA-binding PadR family transcriptional regulator
MSRLGQLEFLVLLSVLRQHEEPYANRIRQDLEENAGRRITRGALYRTVDRLAEKGYLAWELEASQVPDRGGHPMRRLLLTERGVEAVKATRDMLDTFLEGALPVLDELG